MHIQKTDNTSFKARYLTSVEARFKGVANKFDLYQILPEDTLYLENLLTGINLREFMPGLQEEHYKLWEQVLRITLTTSNETILLTKDDKPCGALKYKNQFRDYAIQGRVTWPIKAGIREPFAGKVLLMQLFRLFMKDNFNSIKTCVVRNNPFDTINKCIEMGFRSCGGDNYNELMSANRTRIKQVMDKFKDVIIFKQ